MWTGIVNCQKEKKEFISEITNERQNLPLNTKCRTPGRFRSTYGLQYSVGVPALTVVAEPEKIRRVGSKYTRETTAATSWSVGEATTEDSVDSGDGGVLVAHFCCLRNGVCVVV